MIEQSRVATKTTVTFGQLKIGAMATAAVAFPAGGSAMAQSVPPIFSWTGFYAGAHTGFALSNIPNRHTYSGKGIPPSSWTTRTDIDQGVIGVHFGYKRQFGTLVAGLEADINRNYGSSSAAFSFPALGKANGFALAVPASITARSMMEGSVRGVFGVLTSPNTLVYGTLGVSWANFKFGGMGNLPFSGVPVAVVHNQLSGVRIGVVFGAGIEFALNQMWRGRIEALHAIYSGKTASFNFAGGEETYTVRNKINTTVVRIGISRAFTTGGGAALLP